nr:MAG TPA: Exonuclease [Caudoviricetes sp.]
MGIKRPGENEKTPIAPLLGTAFHLLCEKRSRDMEREAEVLVEQPVYVGDVGGYGPIKGTLDRFDIEAREVMDWKLVSLKKRDAFKRLYRKSQRDGFDVIVEDYGAAQFLQYYIQLCLYGKGMEDQGYDVNNVTLLLLPRDATVHVVESEFTALSMPYDRDLAIYALGRAGLIYKKARESDDLITDLDSAPECFYCSKYRPIHYMKG